MNIPTSKILWKYRNALLVGAILSALVFNLFKTQKKFQSFAVKARTKPFIFIGTQFEGLKDPLHGLQKVGYYTDRSLDERFAAAQFAQAQYVLAPVILDLNNIDHPLVIFDFKNKNKSVQNILELEMIPVSISPSGIILAENPKFQ